jgi:hypothetical protein
MAFRAIAGLLVFASAALIACGGHPGGTVGEICDDPGSTRDCEADEICDDISDGGTYCLLLCSAHEDCASSERCNGVTGSSAKACHPEAESFDDDDDACFDDCGGGKKKKDPF